MWRQGWLPVIHRLVRWSVYVGSESREESRDVLDYRQADYEGMRRELRTSTG